MTVEALSATLTPGRALSQRQRLEMALDDLVMPMVEQFLQVAESAARARLYEMEPLHAMTAAGETIVNPHDIDVHFEEASLNEVWDGIMQTAFAEGVEYVAGFLPEPLRTPVLAGLRANPFLTYLGNSLVELALDKGKAIFKARAMTDVPATDLARQLTKDFAIAAPGNEPNVYSWQAQRASRTIATNVYNQSMIEQLRADGYTLKLWVSHHDEVVRESHLHADGLAIPLDDTFTIGGFKMRYPGDFDAPIGEWINCRCILVGEMGEPSYGIDWSLPVISESDRIAQGLPASVALAASGGPDQARAPEGTSIGGQWITTPGGLLNSVSGVTISKTPPAKKYLPHREPLRVHRGGYIDHEARIENADPETLTWAADAVREAILPATDRGAAINFPLEVFADIGAHRGLRNLHEREVPKSEYIDQYLLNRLQVEKRLGVPDGGKPSDYPTYGWAPEASVGDPALTMNPAKSYGECSVRLKPETLERTTWTLGDSFDSRTQPLFTSELVQASDADMVAWASNRLASVNFNQHEPLLKHDVTESLKNVAYLEAQIHGGVSLADIESVNLTGLGDNELAAAKVFADSGITVYVNGRDITAEVLGASGFNTLTAAGGPTQVRAPKGSSIGGQWIDTPSGILRALNRLRYGSDISDDPLPTDLEAANLERNQMADAILKREGRKGLQEIADRVATIYDATTPEQRTAGALWYAEATGLANDMVAESTTGLTLEQAAAIIAHTSTQTYWEANAFVARHIARGMTGANELQFELLAAIDRGEVPPPKMGGAYVLSDNVKKAVASMSVDHPVGDNQSLGTFTDAANKTRTFAANIMGDTDGVTVDSHMYEVLDEARVVTGKVKGLPQRIRVDQVYESLSQAVRVAAESRGITPAEMQATTWLWDLTARKADYDALNLHAPESLAASGLPADPVVMPIDPEPIPDYWYAQARKFGMTALVAAGGPTQARVPRGNRTGGQWLETPTGHLPAVKGREVKKGRNANRRLPDRPVAAALAAPPPLPDLRAMHETYLPHRISADTAFARNRVLEEWWHQSGYNPVVEHVANRTRETLAAAASGGVHVSVSSSTLDRIIQEGRFKTAHETEGGGVYVTDRRVYEADTMGLPDTTALSAKPVYGWATRQNYMNTSSYGEVDVRLKPGVMDRTTLTMGDSLYAGVRPIWASEAATLSTKDALSASTWATSTPLEKDPIDHNLSTLWYVEAQIHGGVTIDDIESVSMRRGQFYPDTRAALEARGIEVTVELPPFGIDAMKASGEEFAYNPTQARGPDGRWTDTPGAMLDVTKDRRVTFEKPAPISINAVLTGDPVAHAAMQERVNALRAIVEAEKPFAESTSTDRLRAAYKVMGYDKSLPTLVADEAALMAGTSEPTLALKDLEGKVWYRGINGPDGGAAGREAFRTGEHFVGQGFHQDGTYFTTSTYTAAEYGVAVGVQDDAVPILAATIKPGSVQFDIDSDDSLPDSVTYMWTTRLSKEFGVTEPEADQRMRRYGALGSEVFAVLSGADYEEGTNAMGNQVYAVVYNRAALNVMATDAYGVADSDVEY